MKKVKWGLVGYGEQARERMVPALKKIKEIELVSVCCADEEKAERAGEELGIKSYGHLADFLAEPEVEVVYISTPHHLHTPQAYKAVEAGKNVLVEKPIALSVDGAHKLSEVAHRKKVKLGTCFPLRHHPGLKELKEEIEQGRFGELVHIYVYLSRGKLPDKPWWKDQFHSGPLCLMDLGLHGVDLLLWLVGKKAKEVFTLGKGGQNDESLNTSVIISISFDSGALGTISSNNLVPGDSNLIIIQGTEGSARVEMSWPEGEGAVKVQRKGAGKETEKRFEPMDLYKLLAENFNQAVREQVSFSPSAEESQAVVSACCSAIESLKSGKVVKVGEILRVTVPR